MPACVLGFSERENQLHALLEQPQAQRLADAARARLEVLVEIGEVLAAVEDEEVALGFTWTEQVGTEPGTAADHLPELRLRVPSLGVRYQIAQKIHACTEPPPDGKQENPRFHDLLDLILLRELVDQDWAGVRSACTDIFKVRGKQPWPPELVIPPSWPEAFAALAAEHGFDINDVQEAARQVREMIARIDVAGDDA
jgi:hypothetical protein